jgi:transposase
LELWESEKTCRSYSKIVRQNNEACDSAQAFWQPGKGGRQGIYQEVLRLYAGDQGMGLRAIARHLGMNRQTLRKYVRADAFPEIAARIWKSGPVTAFVPYLRKRWDAGCHNATQLWREIRAQGFQGTAAQVRWCLRSWRAALPPHLRRRRTGESVRPALVPSPRQTVWWLLRPLQELEPEAQRFVERLLSSNPEIATARQLALKFQQLVRQRQEDAFDEWHEAVQQSKLTELKNFAAGLLQDEAAVRAALSCEWSNGRTKGNVNRLKMLKRTMFGRANFDLLRLRALHAP